MRREKAELQPQPWWDRKRHEDRRTFLTARNRIKQALRAWFEVQGYTEVETATLQVSPGNETHLHAFETSLIHPDLSRTPLYLHTSPEFACKKLLAAGETRIFSFATVYRNRERTPLHHPEFTMLEWYEVGADYTRMMEQCEEILALTASVTGLKTWAYKGRTADMSQSAENISVADAFQEFAGVAILDTIKGTTADRPMLAAQASASGIRVADDDTWSDIFTRILVEKIEPNLGRDRACFLDRYPIPEAALAQAAQDDPRVAERFELYCCGVELANAFGELSDPIDQRLRFNQDMDEKERLYGERYPIDEEFLAALGALPDCSGCALGFDRLTMLATGAQTIEQVIWTPIAEGFHRQ